MLFAKLFGARRDDDEPTARPVPPVGARSAPPAGPTAANSPAPKAPEPVSTLPVEGKQATAGFDPYNSGAFKKSNAWERVNRR